MNKIKKKYKITTTGYGNLVKEINFTLKSNSKQSITIVIRRSKQNEPIVITSIGFIDIGFKDSFVEIAKELCVWFNEEKKKNNSDDLKKWTAKYWTAQAKTENQSLRLHGTIDVLKMHI